MSKENKAQNIILGQLYSRLQTGPYEPSAIQALAGAVKEEVEGVNISLSSVHDNPESVDEFLEKCKETKPSVIGLSVPQGTYNLAQKVITSIMEDPEFEQTQLVLGGGIPSQYDGFKEEYPDLIQVRGWGEEEFVNIVRAKLGKTTLDLAGKDYAPIRTNQFEKHIRLVETSRGCNYGKCLFCTRTDGEHRRNRHPIDIEIIRKQLDNLKELGETFIAFADEDFLGDDEQAPELIELLSQYEFNFSASMRVETVVPAEPEKRFKRQGEIRKLADCGLELVFLGVESFVESQQRRFNKHASSGVEGYKKAAEVLVNAGIDVEMGLILFDPETTIDELKTTAYSLYVSGKGINYREGKISGSHPVYNYIGYPFSYLRLQEGALLCKKYNTSREEMDPDMLTYDWKFKDPAVEKVYKRCSNWFSELDGMYRLGRALVRSVPNDSEIREELNFELEKIKLTSVKLLFIALGSEDKDFTTYSNESTLAVINSIKHIYLIAERKSDLFNPDTLSQLKSALEQHSEFRRVWEK